MRSIVKDFRHTPGDHCISTALSNYLSYFDLRISEGMAFGLDCGLGFCYKKSDVLSKVPAFYTGGRIYSWVDTICNILGIQHVRKTYTDSTIAWDETKLSIDQNIPVMVELDKSCLDYWGGVLREVPFHMVLAVGYTEDADKVWIADAYAPQINDSRLPDNLHVTGIQGFMDARTAHPHWGEINCAVHLIDIPQNYKFNIKQAIHRAIVLNNSLYLEDTNMTGQKALVEFCEDIVRWPDILPLKLFSQQYQKQISPLRAQLLVTGKMFDEVGTGGGNFRILYQNFLAESAVIFDNNPQISQAALLMEDSAKYWKKGADMLCESARLKEDEIPGALQKVQTILKKCLELEQKTFKILKKWSENYHEI